MPFRGWSANRLSGCYGPRGNLPRITCWGFLQSGLKDINELPIVYNISWYEQKAVTVLLALLSLGIKNIHLGPTLPAFVSPTVVNVLVKNFGISPIGTADEDLAKLVG